MSTSQLFEWPTAKAALNAGWRVRRSGWTDRWLERWTGGLIWLILSDGTKRVVQNTDFGADEFLALDWTNLSTECVTTGTTAGTGTNGCPLPYSPSTPTSSTSGSSGSSSTGSSSTVAADQTPSGAAGAGQVGSGSSGGGGGAGGGSGTNTTVQRNNRNVVWPQISLTIQDTQVNCYEPSNYPDGFVKPIFMGTVSLSNPSGTPGSSVLFVSVKNGPSTVVSCSLGPGGSYGFQWSDPYSAYPGSTLTFTARAWASGSPDIQASASATLLDWCQYSLAFDCEIDGGCHEGVGWVTVRDANAAILYDGCPNQGALGMGAGVTITAGCSVSVQYSNSDGPCPGGHCCDAAKFRISLWHNGTSVLIGEANLNNGNDCGNRGPFTFTISQEQIDSLETP
ncbi:MAG: hypothetical protein ACFUZC_07645 [Chthoniobacteraceae bacterium]